MLVATFNETTGWKGRTIDYENGQLTLQGVGPVSAVTVALYDSQGHLTWPYQEMREWLLAQAEALPSGGLPQVSSSEAICACPVCRSGRLVQEKQNVVCPACGALFKRKGRGYVINPKRAFGSQIVRRYYKDELTIAEWSRIAEGGGSDAEQDEADLARFLEAIGSGQARFESNPDSPVPLRPGEFLVAVCPGLTLREPRTVTSGVYAGPRVRVNNWLSFNVGGFRAAPHDELKDIDKGTFVLTNKRFTFMGAKRTSAANLSTVVGIQPYTDAISIHRSGKQRIETFCGLGRQTFTYQVDGREHAEKLTGAILAFIIESLAASGGAQPAPASRVDAAPSKASESNLDQLERLTKLHSQGALTDDEFAAMKAKIIG